LDALDRLSRRLADAVHDEYGDAAQPPLTIAEVYQKLVPYRTVRGELGFGELAEYEHTLLRLLSGERGYVHVELEPVRDELRRELRSANPILGVYRDYAAVGVRLGAGAPEVAAPAAPAPAARPAEPPHAETAVAPEPLPAPAPVRGVPPVAPRPVGCRSCAEPLPQGREVRFCPFCGTSQHPVPCRDCGTPLEPEWGFCIRCGAARHSAAAPR
jgi:hypothetical protein